MNVVHGDKCVFSCVMSLAIKTEDDIIKPGMASGGGIKILKKLQLWQKVGQNLMAGTAKLDGTGKWAGDHKTKTTGDTNRNYKTEPFQEFMYKF